MFEHPRPFHIRRTPYWRKLLDELQYDNHQ